MSELPPEVDKVLVEGGYKGKLGAMAHNTLVHRTAQQMQGITLREREV